MRALMAQVEALAGKGQWDEALRVMQDEVDRYPGNVALRSGLGNMAVRGERYGRALAVYQELLDKIDKDSKLAGDLHARMGEVYRRLGDLESALHSLRRAVEILPDSPGVLATMALVLDVSGRRQEAAREYRELLRIDPNNGVAMNNLAYRLAEDGVEFEEALTLAKRARELMPQLIEVDDTIGWVYLKMKQTEKAIESFRGLVEKRPESAEFHYHLGMALVQKGDKVAAAQQLELAMQKHPSKAIAEQAARLLQSISGAGR